MKKFHLICLSMLFLICGVVFSACSSDVFAKTIYFLDYSANSTVEISTSQKIELKVGMTPSNVTNKEFEAFILDEGKSDLLSFTCDQKTMKLTIIAASELEEVTTITLTIKLKAKKSNASSVIKVKINAPNNLDTQVLSSPEVSFDGIGNITWTRVNNSTGYEVNILKDEEVVKTQTFTTNTLTMPLEMNTLAGHQVTAKVKAKGRTPDLDSEYSIVNFDILAIPGNLSFDIENQKVVWDEVENSSGYNLKFGNRIMHVDQNYFDAKGYFDLAGTTNLSIMAVASADEEFYSSPYSNQISVTKLKNVSTWVLENDILSWNAITGATSYKVSIKNEQTNIEHVIENNQIDLSYENLQAGNYNVLVTPSSSTNFTIDGETKQYGVQKLPKISGLKLENGKICWNSSASTYKIYIDGELYSQTKLANFDYSEINSQMITEFNIRAVGDNVSKISSDLLFEELNPLKIYKLTNPDLNFDGQGNVSWQQIANASGYKILIDESFIIQIDKNSNSANINDGSIDYSQPKNISFVTKGDGDGEISLINRAIYLDSNPTYRTATKLSPVSVQYERKDGVDNLIWSGTNAGGYRVFATDGTINYVSGVVNQSYFAVDNFITDEELLSTKTYQTYVKTLSVPTSQDDWYFDSDASEILEIKKLPNVSLNVNNGIIEWNYEEIENITGYKISLTQGDNVTNIDDVSRSENDFNFNEQIAGDYEFSITAVGDELYNFVSSNKSILQVKKLSKIESVSIEKTSTANFYSPSDKYKISFADANNQKANYVCKLDEDNVEVAYENGSYFVEILGSQISENNNVVILVRGDNEKYISCENFEFVLTKKELPNISTNNTGTKIKTDVDEYYGLLKVENQENGQVFTGLKNDEFVFETERQFKIKSVAFSQVQTVQNSQTLTVDSSYSEVYKISKLSQPQLYVDNGILKVRATDSSNIQSYFLNFSVKGEDKSADSEKFANLNEYFPENYGTCTVNGYFVDSNTGTMNEGVVYLRSDNSANITVKTMPKPTNVYVRDGVIYVGFNEGTEIFGSKLAIYVNEIDVTDDDNTQTSYEFSKEDVYKEPGVYTIKAKVLSKMSGYDEVATYSLNGEMSESIDAIKLEAVDDISITAFVPEENGTVADLMTSIAMAQNALPNSMPTQSGVLKFKAVEHAVKYMITNANNANVKMYIDAPQDQDYVYVDFQGTNFGYGLNNIIIKAIGNQKEIIDSEDSENFEFNKLKAPINLKIQDGKIVWADANESNNSSLNNASLLIVDYPEWMFDADKNAIIYYAKINGKFICTLDLSSMTSLDLASLCELTNKLKDLSYDANLSTTESNVYTVQICATAMNSYISESITNIVFDLDNLMSKAASQTNNVYVNSDFSNAILVSPVTAPYSLTINNKILSWITPYSNSNSVESVKLSNAGFEVSGYKLQVYKNGDLQYIGGDEYISISGANKTTWNFGDYLDGLINDGEETEGNYSFKVKTIVRQKTGVVDPEVYYVNSAYSLSFSTTALKTPELGVYKGQIAWQMVDDSTGYTLMVDGVEYTTYDNENMFELTDQMYVFNGNLSEGEHEVKLMANGGDEKYLISSGFCDPITYTKLKKVQLAINSTSGMVELRVDNQNKPDSTAWSYIISIEGFDDINIAHLNVFDMAKKDNGYEGGQVYSIRASAKFTIEDFMLADENNAILNSDVSNLLSAYKLKAPTKFDLADNYQSLAWLNGDDNVANLSYVLSISGNILSMDQRTKYNFDSTGVDFGEINAEVFVHAIYGGVVNIDGNDYYCLKSNANEYVNVHKLAAPDGISFVDGVMKWTKTYAENAETHLVINGQKSNEIINEDHYDFEQEDVGLYNVYLYNKRSEQRTATDIYLSSKNTDTYQISKIKTPTNIALEQRYEVFNNSIEKEYKVTFSTIQNARKYQVIVVIDEQEYPIALINANDTELLTIYGDLADYVIDNSVLVDGSMLTNILNSNSFTIKIKAIGSSGIELNAVNYANSNFNRLVAERCEKTELIEKQTDLILSSDGLANMFTGKVNWNNVDEASRYYIEVECIDELDASGNVFINNAGQSLVTCGNKKIYLTNKNFAQFAHAGNYTFSIVSIPNSLDEILQSDGSYLKKIPSVSNRFVGELAYSLYADGEGTETNPYVVNSFGQYNCIKYNIYANYIFGENINCNIDLENNLSFNAIDEFYGIIDGNDKILTVLNADNFAGIVKILREGASICNLTIQGSITVAKTNEMEVVIGGIAGINYGKIEKCLNKLSIIDTSSSLSTIGGIAGINYGEIIGCGNLGNITGNIVGGIVGKMFGELVSKCYNGADGTITIKSNVNRLPYDLGRFTTDTYCGFAGGIVGYQNTENDGIISSCYSYSAVYCDNSSIGGTAYVGGIAGYIAGNSQIKNCYAIDSYNSYTRTRLIRAKINDNAKVGILVGLVETNSITVQNCAVVYNNATTINQVKSYAIGEGYNADGIVGVIKDGTTEYQYIYEVVSTDNEGVYQSNTNKYCTLADAKYKE